MTVYRVSIISLDTSKDGKEFICTKTGSDYVVDTHIDYDTIVVPVKIHINLFKYIILRYYDNGIKEIK